MPSCKLQFDPLSPKSFCLHSIDELYNWMPSNNTFNISNIPLQYREKDNSRSKLILIHDMAGGYTEDKYIQGNAYDSTYYFQYWHLADIFIYFSRKRVSIPPVNWTNNCHRNGVQCLGTFFIKGNNHMHEIEILLQGPCHLRNNDDNDNLRLWSPFFADKLVYIAKYYNFDGWLIYIECEFFPFPTSSQYKAQEFAKFLGYLTETMHQELPGSKVIWYDSMTYTSKINWQNQLTDKNELFFKSTDGIILNYWRKKLYPTIAQRLTAERYYNKSSFDIYFGINIWGKYIQGGSNFKSYKDIEIASSTHVSSALFGTAWIYETFEKKEFERIDRLFWCGGKYSDYPPLPLKNLKNNVNTEDDDSEDELIYDQKKGISDVIPTRSVPGTYWFVTNFDRGFGKHFAHRGKILLRQPWSHLSHQSILPNLDYQNLIMCPFDRNIDISCTLQDTFGAFLGGTCLVVKGQRLTHRESHDMEMDVVIPLYQMNISVSQGCILKYIYRTLLAEDVKLIMLYQFTLQNPKDSFSSVSDFCKSWLPENNFDIEDGSRITISSASDACDSQCFTLPIVENSIHGGAWTMTTTQIPAVAEESGYSLLLNRIELCVVINTASLVGIKLHTIACLGYLSIIPAFTNICVILQEETYRFFGTICWNKLTESTNDWKDVDYYIISYEIDGKNRIFLGTAFCNEYRISGLECINKARRHKIIIETVTREGTIPSSTSLNIVL
ncbi:endo-b-N-acetylglucosaminidase [Cokeromyces recurvatus]|uniref:endo-b-N-acetylglucosaminidase n=1 Tax=Cokeromyces recurvatus TaxID=90255 RepID=UPI00222072E7|nr:endo-b-N-acetylglucosaminidase [Cokeromyces recurvatus]KAI7906381.1 endo-b-N-acetylglucosaminidase [Cokeromyces recurvatus]